MSNQENSDRIYLISDIEGLTPQLGRLVSMMNYARLTTLNTVKGLSAEKLDFLVDSKCNSIGALLMHMAAVEFGYQVETFFGGREITEEEKLEWGAAYKLGDMGRDQIKGHALDYYLNILENTRKITIEEFKKRDDQWLYEESSFWHDLPANNYFKWFHVFEDEINHRGQIRWMRKRLPENLL